jgi:tRNA(Phe) wybutosine-synthesizing methylase Tyw3
MTLDKKVLMKLIPDDAFDKYVSPFINFLNSISGSKTSPSCVGQLSELFQDFINEYSQKNIKPSIEK